MNDVIVIGGGAAGLFAATAAGERGRNTLLLEKNSKIGVKILMSGGTRCNITQDTGRKSIVEAFGRNGRFLHSALAQMGPEEVVEWVEQEGVKTKIEPGGKIFPASDRAIDVRDALFRRVTRCPNVEIRTGTSVSQIERNAAGFRLNGNGETFVSQALIVTTGGRSYPGCGTTGDGYPWMQSFGHSVVPPVPALTPIVSPEEWVRELKGITVTDCRVGVFAVEEQSRVSHQNFGRIAKMVSRGSLLFTHFGLSGPAVLNVSKSVSRHRETDLPVNDLILLIDFLPEQPDDVLRSEFSGESRSKSVGRWLGECLPSRLATSLVRQAGLETERRMAEIPASGRRQLIETLKRCTVRMEGTRGYKKAEVTAGGVNLKEVNSQTMESKLCSGLFLAGEILDLDGPIGGYNFQAAFSTGFLAGLHA